MKHIFHTIIILFMFGICAAPAFGASVSIISAPSAAAVMLAADGESVNAVAGTIRIPDGVRVTSIDTTDSIVVLWIEQPRVEGDQLRWSGVIPGGYDGTRSAYSAGVQPGVLFTIQFQADAPMEAVITVMDLDIRANDGHGTALAATATPAVIAIGTVQAPVARQAAGSLAATVAKSDELGGVWFVAFNEDTSRRSIDRYEAVESVFADPNRVREREWVAVTTPYILEHQSRDRYVHIRSVGIDGSVSTITIQPVDDSMQHAWTWSILLLLVIALCIAARTPIRHHDKHTP